MLDGVACMAACYYSSMAIGIGQQEAITNSP